MMTTTGGACPKCGKQYTPGNPAHVCLGKKPAAPSSKQGCTCKVTCLRQGRPFPADWSWKCLQLPYMQEWRSADETTRELASSEAASFDKAFARSPRRVDETNGKWIDCAERMPTYADGKGRDMSVLGWLTDVPGDWSIAGACSVSYFNVEGWVKEGKCRYWTHLPDGPSEKSEGEPK